MSCSAGNNAQPTVTPLPVKVSDDARVMLRADLENENETVKNYTERVQQAEGLREYAIAEDLREILRYVPRFRDRVVVIALDGAVVEDENFRNLLIDVALLRSLRIGVALVHGAAHQIRRLA